MFMPQHILWVEVPHLRNSNDGILELHELPDPKRVRGIHE